MKQFINYHVWAHLPKTIKDSHRLWASALWGGALVIVGVIVLWLRMRKGVDVGTAPWIWGGVGVIVALVLLTKGPGSAFYMFVLRFFAIQNYIIVTVVLTLGFYLILTPMALLLKLVGKDLLRTGRRTRPMWIEHPGPPDRKRYYRLF